MTTYRCTKCGKTFEWDESDFFDDNMVDHFADQHPDEIMNFFDEE